MFEELPVPGAALPRPGLYKYDKVLADDTWPTTSQRLTIATLAVEPVTQIVPFVPPGLGSSSAASPARARPGGRPRPRRSSGSVVGPPGPPITLHVPELLLHLGHVSLHGDHGVVHDLQKQNIFLLANQHQAYLSRDSFVISWRASTGGCCGFIFKMGDKSLVNLSWSEGSTGRVDHFLGYRSEQNFSL